MIRRPPRSTRVRSSAASDVYKRQAEVIGRMTDLEDRLSMLIGIAYHTFLAEIRFAHLELRLDHKNHIALRLAHCCQRWHHHSKRDERQVGDDEFDWTPDVGGSEGPYVRAVQHVDAFIGLKCPHELAVADVHGADALSDLAQQYVGEATGRGAGVKTTLAFY